MKYDKIIIGAGLYGLYSALFCGKKGEKVIVLESDDEAFKRATYINQARVHMGYHYPRSYSTAIKSAHYFERFNNDFKFSINSQFSKVYATSANFSWSNADQFRKFCMDTGVTCEDIPPVKYFKPDMCDGSFVTQEYTYDAHILRDYYLEELSRFGNVTIKYGSNIKGISSLQNTFQLKLYSGEKIESEFVLNATYASVNQITQMLGYEPFKIKYELCEIILCQAGDRLKDVGITVMDGPFFSIMPFGKTGLHSLTSVTFTPHITSYDTVPTFDCQQRSNGYCSPAKLGNCNECNAKPESAWNYMSNLARKYLREEFNFDYVKSLYSMKPILKASEVDDSRPTVIKVHSVGPTFVSVLSGKINTVYDLDEVLTNGK